MTVGGWRGNFEMPEVRDGSQPPVRPGKEVRMHKHAVYVLLHRWHFPLAAPRGA